MEAFSTAPCSASNAASASPNATSSSIAIGGHLASGSDSASACRRSATPGNAGIRGDGSRSAAMVVATAVAICASASTPLVLGVMPAASERFTNDSAGVVMPVITGTSVIANAPLMVCTARNRSSDAGSGCSCDCASQWFTVSR
ncbi:hypothetical protein D3C71_1320460 [compost metagenome]